MAFVGLSNAILTTAGAASYWPCHEASGNTLADVIAGKTLTGVGTPTTGVAGAVNNCVSLDGVDDYFGYAGAVIGATAPAEWWMFGAYRAIAQDQKFPFGAASNTVSGAFIGVSSGESAFSNIARMMGYQWGDGGAKWNPTDSNVTLGDAAWHTILITRKSGTNYLYVDGVLRSSSAFSPGTCTLDKFAIGCLLRSTPGFYWNGRAQHVAVGTAGLDSTAVAALHTAFGALNAGSIRATAIGATTADLVCSAAQQGTGPYTYQWYRSTTPNFTPGAGNIISGATNLTLNDTGLTATTTYYYKVVVTDAAAATDVTIQATIPTATPGGWQWVVAGWSHFSGYWQTTPVPTLANAKLSGGSLTNLSVAGRTLQEVHDNDITTLAGLWDPDTFTTGQVAVLSEACNSLVAGVTLANLKALTISTCAAIRAIGYKLVLVAPLPDKATVMTTQMRLDLTAYYEWLLTEWPDLADVFVDIRRDSRIGQPNSPDDLAYYNADKRHLIDAGAELFAQDLTMAVAMALTVRTASGGSGGGSISGILTGGRL